MAHASRTRGGKIETDDENIIQRVVEKIFQSEEFISRLVDKISETISKKLASENKVLIEKVESLDNELMEMQNKIDIQEQFTRRNNLRIYGMPEVESENLQENLINIFDQKLGIKINKVDFDSCYRLKGKEGSHRPIMVRFSRYVVKQDIFRNKSKLKGTKMVIKEDLTAKRMGIYQKVCEEFDFKNVWTAEGNIICKINDKIVKISSFEDLNRFKN